MTRRLIHIEDNVHVAVEILDGSATIQCYLEMNGERRAIGESKYVSAGTKFSVGPLTMELMEVSTEQKLRDILEGMGWKDAQQLTTKDLAALASMMTK